MKRPVSPGVAITQYFGKTPFDDNHTGLDFSGLGDRKVFAAESGDISYIYDSKYGGGNILRIDGPTGQTRYVHLSKVYVKSGKVKEGQLIGVMGNTGRPGMKVHLHFGLRRGGQFVNPLPYLKSTGGGGTTNDMYPDADDVDDIIFLATGKHATAAQKAGYVKETWHNLAGDAIRAALAKGAVPLKSGTKYIVP